MALVNLNTKKTIILLDSRNKPRCVTSFYGAHIYNFAPGQHSHLHENVAAVTNRW